jgi:hypothetical protein
MMWYDRVMFLTRERPRFWPFVLLALVGLLLIGGTVAVLAADQAELPAVELPK